MEKWKFLKIGKCEKNLSLRTMSHECKNVRAENPHLANHPQITTPTFSHVLLSPL